MTSPNKSNEIEIVDFLSNVVFAKTAPKWIKNQAQSHLKNYPDGLGLPSAGFFRMVWGLNSDGELAMINGKWNPSL